MDSLGQRKTQEPRVPARTAQCRSGGRGREVMGHMDHAVLSQVIQDSEGAALRGTGDLRWG